MVHLVAGKLGPTDALLTMHCDGAPHHRHQEFSVRGACRHHQWFTGCAGADELQSKILGKGRVLAADTEAGATSHYMHIVSC